MKTTLLAVLSCSLMLLSIPCLCSDVKEDPANASAAPGIESNGIYQGFSGGMFLNGGYTNVDSDVVPSGTISGFTFGLGGKLAFNFTRFFRVGLGGYTSKCIYDDNNSYYSIGWGGFSLEGIYRISFLRIALGLMIGGGSINQMHIADATGDKTNGLTGDVFFRARGTFLYTPTLSFEFFVSDSICLLLMIDFLMGLPGDIGDNADFWTGPRGFVGILFNKQ